MGDGRLSEKEAAALAAKANGTPGIPIVINPRVVKSLNTALGSPRMRSHMRKNLRRMLRFEAMIRAKLKTANLPEDLPAVPLLESGFKNVGDGTPWACGSSFRKRRAITVFA